MDEYRPICTQKTPTSTSITYKLESTAKGKGIHSMWFRNQTKKICSQEKDCESRKNDLTEQLRKRGYKTYNIGEQLEKVDKLNRQHILNYNQPNNSDRIPLVLTYSDALPNIHSILWKHMNTLHWSDELREIFPTPPLVAYRRDKNLQEIIIKKNHNSMFYKKPNICEHCGTNCALCKYIIRSDTFFGTDGKEYKVSKALESLRCTIIKCTDFE